MALRKQTTKRRGPLLAEDKTCPPDLTLESHQLVHSLSSDSIASALDRPQLDRITLGACIARLVAVSCRAEPRRHPRDSYRSASWPYSIASRRTSQWITGRIQTRRRKSSSRNVQPVGWLAYELSRARLTRASRHCFQATTTEGLAAHPHSQSRLAYPLPHRNHLCSYWSFDSMGQWKSHDHTAGLHRM